MAARKSSNEQQALLYMQELGIAPARSMQPFLQELARRHGRELARRLERAMASRASGKAGEDIYAIKNENVQLSLDFAGFSADLYRRVFDWLAAWAHARPDCRSMLDIGCDNGITTCFLARLYPGASVTGLDCSEMSVNNARRLAERLGLSNVSFLCGDFRTFRRDGGSAKRYDLLFSLRSLHEMMPEAFSQRYWSLYDLARQLAEGGPSRYASVLTVVQDVVTPGGSFISGERLTHAGMVLEWVWSMEQAGLALRWPEATWISFHELGEKQRLPILTAGAGCENAGGPGSGDGILMRVYEFLDTGGPAKLRKGGIWTDIPAERALYAAQGRSFIGGLQIDYRSGAGSERHELWAWADCVLAYRYSDLGYRELRVLDKGELDAEVEFARLEEAHRAVGECVRYGEPREVTGTVSDSFERQPQDHPVSAPSRSNPFSDF